MRMELVDRMGALAGYTLVDPEDAMRLRAMPRRMCLDRSGDYALVPVIGAGQPTRLHRYLLGLERGDRRHVIHPNGDVLDNRRGNLRVVTVTEARREAVRLASPDRSHWDGFPIVEYLPHPANRAVEYDVLPIHDGDVVVAHARIDPEAWHELAAHQWFIDGEGYGARGKTNGVKMHRVILGLSAGDKRCGDHKNRDRLDNRRENLRILTKGHNAQNASVRRDSTSGYRGVTARADGRWTARVRVDNVRHYLGAFDDPAEAHEVVLAFRREHMPYAID